jgi:hypothetical protein
LDFCEKSEERWARKRSQGKGGWKLQGCHDGFVEHDGFKSALLTGRGQGLIKIKAHKTKRLHLQGNIERRSNGSAL